MLKIFISLILATILFLSNSNELLANQEEILEIEIPITKNEDSKITNKNTPLANKKKSLDKNLNLQKTTNLLNSCYNY